MLLERGEYSLFVAKQSLVHSVFSLEEKGRHVKPQPPDQRPNIMQSCSRQHLRINRHRPGGHFSPPPACLSSVCPSAGVTLSLALSLSHSHFPCLALSVSVPPSLSSLLHLSHSLIFSLFLCFTLALTHTCTHLPVYTYSAVQFMFFCLCTPAHWV